MFSFSSNRAQRRHASPFLLLGATLFAITVFGTGCDTGEIGDDLNLRVAFDPAPTLITGKALDSDGTPFEGSGDVVTLTFSGPDANRVVDVTGEQVSEITVSELGLISFGIKEPVPTSSDAANITVALSTPDGRTDTKSLTITSDELDEPFTAFNDPSESTNTGNLTVNGDVTVLCEGEEDVEIRPTSFAVWYHPLSEDGTVDGTAWNYARLKEGKTTIENLEEGRKYEIRVWLKDRWESSTFRLNPDAGDQGEGVTVTQTGDGTYKVTLNVTAGRSICSN